MGDMDAERCERKFHGGNLLEPKSGNVVPNIDVHAVDINVLFIFLGQPTECAWKHHIVGIDNADDGACGSLYAFVEGIAYAIVFFGDDFGDVRFVAFYDVQRMVGGTSIHDDVFELVVALVLHTYDGFLDGFLAVERYGDNAYLWLGHRSIRVE